MNEDLKQSMDEGLMNQPTDEGLMNQPTDEENFSSYRLENLCLSLIEIDKFYSHWICWYKYYGVFEISASHLNNYKDSFQHFRSAYSACEKKDALAMNVQIELINEHLTRMAIDICVEILQHQLKILSYIARLYGKFFTKHMDYKKIKEAHKMMETITKCIHEGKELLFCLRHSKAELFRIFDFDTGWQFSKEFYQLIEKVDENLTKINDLIKLRASTTYIYEKLQSNM